MFPVSFAVIPESRCWHDTWRFFLSPLDVFIERKAWNADQIRLPSSVAALLRAVLGFLLPNIHVLYNQSWNLQSTDPVIYWWYFKTHFLFSFLCESLWPSRASHATHTWVIYKNAHGIFWHIDFHKISMCLSLSSGIRRCIQFKSASRS